MAPSSSSPPKTPTMGPDPILISRTQMDALYTILEAVTNALETLRVPWILTGGSLLGSVRQHSILFTDDDVDLAIVGLDHYAIVVEKLQGLLGDEFVYTPNVWEGGDRVRWKKVSNIFVDLFVLREYKNVMALREAIQRKANGQPQPESYITMILSTIQDAAEAGQHDNQALYPCWHFAQRKAIELWPKEVYRTYELFPLVTEYHMGPLRNLPGPRTPVLLLERAFGNDCFDVYYQSVGHTGTARSPSSNSDRSDSNALPPRVQPGGLWEHAPKTPLQLEHYIPIQPVARARRRPTEHNQTALQSYLQSQRAEEERWIEQQKHPWDMPSTVPPPPTPHTAPPRRTVYMDGVFDLFHVGHLRAIEQCAALGDRVILGVTGDADAAWYKRPPILSQDDRVAVLRGLRCVDTIVCPCPLVVTESFLQVHGIDLVVHGFADDADAERQAGFFVEPLRLGKFQRIEYYPHLSTSDIITKIQSLGKEEDELMAKPKSTGKWFGSALRAATNGAPVLDLSQKNVMRAIEPHIAKARDLRDRVLEQTQQERNTKAADLGDVLLPFANEVDFGYDTSTHCIREALLRASGLPVDTDLTRLHTDLETKYNMLEALTENFTEFQETLSQFILQVCAPRMPQSETDELFFQAFPCIRVIQPDDFSIGPHSDIDYGHHPASVNFYVPLTPIYGTASLYLESAVGKEDWHPIIGNYGSVKQFHGATCLHWTPENTTGSTRVSLDIRLIDGHLFRTLQFRGDEGLRQGYYSCCRKNSSGTWERQAPLPRPDARMGFPWTVKDWSKVRNTQKKETK